MKSKLKAPGTKCLKLKYDNLLSSFAFKFNLRHYIVEAEGPGLTLGVEPFNIFARLAGGAMPNLVDQGALGTHAARPTPHYLFPLNLGIFEVRDGINQV